MNKFILKLLAVSVIMLSQNIGVNILTPTHTLHVVVDPTNPNQDPLKIENFGQ